MSCEFCVMLGVSVGLVLHTAFRFLIQAIFTQCTKTNRHPQGKSSAAEIPYASVF